MTTPAWCHTYDYASTWSHCHTHDYTSVHPSQPCLALQALQKLAELSFIPLERSRLDTCMHTAQGLHPAVQVSGWVWGVLRKQARSGLNPEQQECPSPSPRRKP